jgi:cytochrome oxidase Cu insertion factor (SCO1/SenC/PrrC family)
MNADKKISKERLAAILLLIIVGTAFASVITRIVIQKSLPEIFRIPPLKVGMTAPNFQLATLQNQTVSLAQFRGKPLVLMFWGSS